MLNLRERQTKSIEIAGEGETKYRFTFTRFSGIEMSRYRTYQAFAFEHAQAKTGIDYQSFLALNKRYGIVKSLSGAEREHWEFWVACMCWARTISALTKLESSDGDEWQEEEIPKRWHTPEGYLSSFDDYADVFDIDTVAISLNREALGIAEVSEDDKKKDEPSTPLSKKPLANSQKAPRATKTKSQKKETPTR